MKTTKRSGAQPKKRRDPTPEEMAKLPPHSSYIALADGTLSIVDTSDFDSLNLHRWVLSNRQYAERKEWIDGRTVGITMHRQLLNVPKGLCVDHINGNKLDNRRCNLRLATKAQNAWNSKTYSTNKVGIKGVSELSPGKWVAQIFIRGKNVRLGPFDSSEKASLAYSSEASKHRGDFANFGSYRKV